jgi:hypothetical protein
MKLGTTLWIGLLLAAVLLAVGCSSSSQPDNQNPSLPAVSPVDFTIFPAAHVLMTASATDPDGDTVNIYWSFSGGTPATALGDTVTWTAPASGTVTITCKARDGRGGEHAATTVATVHANAAYPYGRPFEGSLEPVLDDLSETGSRGFCHFNATVMVGWTSASVLVFTGLPTAAFLEAVTETPVWIPPATWIWSYSVPWGSSHAIVELQAALSGATQLDWQMLISGTILDYDRFQWVTGQSSTDAFQGHWMLYDYRYPTQLKQALRVEFDRVSSTERDVDYFNVLQSSGGYGDSLSYALHGTAAEVKLDQVGPPFTSVRAAWDTFDGSGRFYGAGGDSCCWGPRPTFADVTCP